MMTPEGKVIETAGTNYAFAIEPVAKVFTLALIMSESGPDVVKQKLGSSGIGLPFNSVIALALHRRSGESAGASWRHGDRQSGEWDERGRALAKDQQENGRFCRR
jgi:hypothetical protein